MKCKIYYDDGSVWSLPPPVKPPSRGVQVIVQDHPDIGWHTQSGSDYYVPRGGRYVGVDIFGLFDWLLERGEVLFGRTTTSGEFHEAMGRALKDLDGEKVGWLKNERRPE